MNTKLLGYGPQFDEEADEDEDNNPMSIIVECGRRGKDSIELFKKREERESYIKEGK
jgi:hypothetical protein